jgi:glutathione S-transferase
VETTYRLITIPPSHYCEKARWALDRVGASYQEEPHPPLLHYRPCKKAGGGRTTPVLVTDVGVYPDSTDILKYLDLRDQGASGLFPEDPAQRREVERFEEFFDERLGPHTRRLAYFHLLPHSALVKESLLDRVGNFDRTIFRATLPLMRFLMRRGMNINEESAERSLHKVREVFNAVGERISDGRHYLVGKRFTAADLCFAALAAPVILPRGYGSHLPSLAEMPSSVLPVIEEMRDTPAGQFAMRLYRDER